MKFHLNVGGKKLSSIKTLRIAAALRAINHIRLGNQAEANTQHTTFVGSCSYENNSRPFELLFFSPEEPQNNSNSVCMKI